MYTGRKDTKKSQYAISNHFGHRPGRLQIEAACHRIHIENFSGKIQPGMLPAFKGLAIDLAERAPSAGDEVFCESSWHRLPPTSGLRGCRICAADVSKLSP